MLIAESDGDSVNIWRSYGHE